MEPKGSLNRKPKLGNSENESRSSATIPIPEGPIRLHPILVAHNASKAARMGSSSAKENLTSCDTDFCIWGNSNKGIEDKTKSIPLLRQPIRRKEHYKAVLVAIWEQH
jgi:hypothetical protein